MNRIELKSKRDGHHRIGTSLEKRAKAAGRDSKIYAQYLHHIEEYVRISDLLKIDEREMKRMRHLKTGWKKAF